MNNRPGRPRGGRTDAKERLLAEARRSFVERGYTRTTLRAVAAACDVDVALVSHHFGSKRGLFAAAMAVQVGPADVVASATRNGTVDPALLLASLIRVWEDPSVGPPLRALALAALADAGQRAALREYMEQEVLGALARHLPGPHAERRARAAAYVLSGAVLSHYVLGVDAGRGPETLFADLIGPLTAALHPPQVRAGAHGPHGPTG